GQPRRLDGFHPLPTRGRPGGVGSRGVRTVVGVQQPRYRPHGGLGSPLLGRGSDESSHLGQPRRPNGPRPLPVSESPTSLFKYLPRPKRGMTGEPRSPATSPDSNHDKLTTMRWSREG